MTDQNVLFLLNRAADLAQSVHEDRREASWCEDIEQDIREALKILEKP